jgi:hypothetical protein
MLKASLPSLVAAAAIAQSSHAFAQIPAQPSPPAAGPVVAPTPNALPSLPMPMPVGNGGAGAGVTTGATTPAASSTSTAATPPQSAAANGSANTVAGTVAGATGGGEPPKADLAAASATDSTASAGARAVGMAPPGLVSGNFMDTRLTWTFGDDDFLHPTGELVPLSPTFSIGDRPQYRLFFDGLNSRFAGRENLTHLVMYKKLPGFIPRLTTEAAVVLRFDIGALSANTGNLNSALYDSGSYLRVFYNTNTNNEKEGLSAVFFPLDTDRLRLGYLYDISWGGTAASINQSIFPRIQGSSPGLKLQFDSKKFYAFLGFKTATIVQPERVLNQGSEADVEIVRVGETNYGFLGGAGVDPTEQLRFDIGAGFFQQGRFDLEDVRGKSVYTYGASARAVFHHNMPSPTSVDFLLYKNDPMAPMVIFKPEKYSPGETSWSVSAEGSVLQQRLKDFDVSGATKTQSALAGAIQGVVKSGYLRASVTGIVRNLAFVVRNVPGFIPFESFPQNNTNTAPELFAAGAIDYFFSGIHLTPGASLGVQLPATFKSEFADGAVQASRTIVVRQQGNESILPYNEGRSAIVQFRGNVRWDLSEFLSVIGWAQLVNDNNGTLVVRDPREGTASLRKFQSATRLGIGTAVQARF